MLLCIREMGLFQQVRDILRASGVVAARQWCHSAILSAQSLPCGWSVICGCLNWWDGGGWHQVCELT